MFLTIEGEKTEHGAEKLTLFWKEAKYTKDKNAHASCRYEDTRTEEAYMYQTADCISLFEEKAVMTVLMNLKSIFKQRKKMSRDFPQRMYDKYMDYKQIKLL